MKNLEIEWALDFGDFGTELSVAMEEDLGENLFLAGNFSSMVNFNPEGPDEMHKSKGSVDVFFQKRNKNGKHLWTKTYGGSESDAAKGVVSDKNGNAYILGTFRDTLHYQINGLTHSIKSKGWDDVFLIKYDPYGEFQWIYTFGGSGTDSGLSLCLDSEANIYVSGFFSSTVDFDPSPSEAMKTSYSGWNGDTYILKINQNGIFQWVKSLDGHSLDYGKSICLDANEDIIIGGVFRSEIDLDPGPNIIPVKASDDSEELYLIKLNKNGTYLWGHSFPGLGKDECISIAVDNNNNIYAGGYFATQFIINTLEGSKTLDSNGDSDLFVCKINPEGAILWANSLGGSKEDRLCYLSINEDNILTISGSFKSKDIHQENIVLSSEGNFDALILFMDQDGNFIDAFSFGNYSVDACHHVILKSGRSCLIYGIYSGDLVFNPPIEDIDFHSNGSTDIFIAKLNFDSILDLTAIEKEEIFHIFPNPGRNTITILASPEMDNFDISIRNSAHQEIFIQKQIPGHRFSTNLNVKPGVYIVEIRYKNHVESKKILIF